MRRKEDQGVVVNVKEGEGRKCPNGDLGRFLSPTFHRPQSTDMDPQTLLTSHSDDTISLKTGNDAAVSSSFSETSPSCDPSRRSTPSVLLS